MPPLLGNFQPMEITMTDLTFTPVILTENLLPWLALLWWSTPVQEINVVQEDINLAKMLCDGTI